MPEGRYSDKLIEKVADSQADQLTLLGRIDERTKGTDEDVKRINGSITELWKAHDKLRGRTDSLEQWRSGIIAVTSAAWAGLMAWLKFGDKG